MNDQLKVEGINSKGFGIIPKLLTQDRNICIGAKGLYAYFCSYAGAGDTCFPTRKKICYDLGISKDTFGKYLRKLVWRGYIEVEQIKENGRFSHNVYTLCHTIPPYPKKPYTENIVSKNTVSENFVSEKMVTNNNSPKINNSKNISKKERKQKSSNFSESEKILNFEKDASKAKAFEENKSQIQNLSISKKSVACNKPKDCRKANNNEMKFPDLSINDEDYRDEEGLLICGKCHTRKQVRIKAFGKVREPLCLCKCASEQMSAYQKTKASQRKASKDLRSFNEIIDSYTSNEQLRSELKEYLKVRKQKRAPLTNRALELNLRELSALASCDETKIKIVQTAIMNGWTTFYPLRVIRREKSEPTIRRSYDLDLFNAMTI